MKRTCVCILLLAVYADAISLEGSIADEVKNTEETSALTPPIGSSLFGYVRKTLLQNSEAIGEAMRDTLKDSINLPEAPEEDLSALDDEPLEDIQQSLDIVEVEYPLGTLFEWLEQKAESIQESKFRQIWLNRKKRSNDGQEDEHQDKNPWRGWSESEARMIANIFEDYMQREQDKPKPSDSLDGYEVQEFSEDDLKDIEPVEAQIEDVVVTPTYPLEQNHESQHQISATRASESDIVTHWSGQQTQEHRFETHEEHNPDKQHESHTHEGHDHHTHEEHDHYPHDHYPHEEHDHYPHEEHDHYPHEEHDHYPHDGHDHHTHGEHDDISMHYDDEEVPTVEGKPGEEFPDYTDIPVSSFNCSSYDYSPGFYADMETGCQVFHVCYQERKASFLCPVGTIFNQAVLACDYWHKSNCSQATQYYNLNPVIGDTHDVNQIETVSPTSVAVSSVPEYVVTEVVTEEKNVPSTEHVNDTDSVAVPQLNYRRKYPHLTPSQYLDLFMRFFPVKAKVTVFPVAGRTKVVAVAQVGNIKRKSKNRNRGQGVRAEVFVHLDRKGRPIAEVNPDREAKPYVDTTDEHSEVPPFPDREEADREARPITEEDNEPDREAKPFSEDEEPNREIRPITEDEVEPDREAKPFSEEDLNVEPTDEEPPPIPKDIDDDVHENIDDAFDIVRRVLEEIRSLFPRQDDYPYRRRPTRYPGRWTTRYPGRWTTRYPGRWTTRYPGRWTTRYPGRWTTRYPGRWTTRYPGRWTTRYPGRWTTRYPGRWTTKYPRRPTTSRRPTSYPPTWYPSRRPTRYPSRRPTWYPRRRPTRYPTRKPCKSVPWSKKERYPYRPAATLVTINPKFVVKPTQV